MGLFSYYCKFHISQNHIELAITLPNEDIKSVLVYEVLCGAKKGFSLVFIHGKLKCTWEWPRLVLK